MTYREEILSRHIADAEQTCDYLTFSHDSLESLDVIGERGKKLVDKAFVEVVVALRAVCDHHEIPRPQVFPMKGEETGSYGMCSPDKNQIALATDAIKQRLPHLSSAVMGTALHELGHLISSEADPLRQARIYGGDLCEQIMQFVEDERVENDIRSLCKDYGTFFATLNESCLAHQEKTNEFEGLTAARQFVSIILAYLRWPEILEILELEDFEYNGINVVDELDRLDIRPADSLKSLVDVTFDVYDFVKKHLKEEQDQLEDRKFDDSGLSEQEAAELEDISKLLSKVDKLPEIPLSETPDVVVICPGASEEVEIEPPKIDASTTVLQANKFAENGTRVDGIKSYVVQNVDAPNYEEYRDVSASKLLAHRDATTGQVAKLRKALSVRFSDEEIVETELQEGKIHGRRLPLARVDSHVYHRKYTQEAVGFHAVLMLDESGSMLSHVRKPTPTVSSKLDAARELGIFLATSFVGIPNTSLNVASFSTHYSSAKQVSGSDSYIKHLYSGEKVKPAEMYKKFGRFCGGGSNYDHVAVKYGTKILESKRGFRVLVMLNDGAPAGHSYGGESAEQAVRDAVVAAERQGIVVIQVAIEEFESSVKMYDRKLVFTDNQTLCSDFAKMIKKLASKARYE